MSENTVKLQHEDGSGFRASQVTVHYDGRRENLEVDENGTVEVENRRQAEELLESHGQFFEINDEEVEEELPNYVLADKNVSEVESYVSDVDSVERLEELREKEEENGDRSTAVQHIEERISELEEPEEEESEDEEQEDTTSEEAGEEDDDEEEESEEEESEEVEDEEETEEQEDDEEQEDEGDEDAGEAEGEGDETDE